MALDRDINILEAKGEPRAPCGRPAKKYFSLPSTASFVFYPNRPNTKWFWTHSTKQLKGNCNFSVLKSLSVANITSLTVNQDTHMHAADRDVLMMSTGSLLFDEQFVCVCLSGEKSAWVSQFRVGGGFYPKNHKSGCKMSNAEIKCIWTLFYIIQVSIIITRVLPCLNHRSIWIEGVSIGVMCFLL